MQKKFKQIIFVLSFVLFGLFVTTSNTSAAGLNRSMLNLPRVDVVDVSSWNGSLSVSQFSDMRSEGVKGVVVKVTEGSEDGTAYVNPYAATQASNARAAGMVVSYYHFARYDSEEDARVEARFFAKNARLVGADSNSLMVNDVEAGELSKDSAAMTNEALAFKKELQRAGFNRTDTYVGNKWYNTSINFARLGQRGWVANYPAYPTAGQSLYSGANAWQWASDYNFSSTGSMRFDVSQDYTGMYTNRYVNTSSIF